ncbi:MAG: double-strand break repair protein AddB [Dongiaceae bacterium]
MTGAAAAARVFTIPPGVGFVDALAAALLAEGAADPLALADVTVLLPTRRSARALQEALLRRSDGRPLLLPRLQPLGDVDVDALELGSGEGEDGAAALSLPPALPPLRRQLVLTRLVLRYERAGAQPDQAARLAADLGRLLDEVGTHGLGFDRLAGLVPADYARHWQETLRFLAILTEHWPAILAELGAIDAVERRDRLLRARAAAWAAAPPPGPVIAAGSTGSIPATAGLLAVIARLPQGRVVLPGLDRQADDATWEAIGRDPGHPQHGLHQLLDRLGVARTEVGDWPVAGLAATPPARGRVLAEALRPAETTEAWGASLPDAAARERARLGLAGVRRIDCPGPAEEARVIALLLRERLERPGERAALVTPDRTLARRVAAELARWDIAIDDSAGEPLADTPPGIFLRLTAGLLVERLAPVPLLALLKHPLAAGGREPAALRRLARRLDRKLRGPRPAPGPDGLRAALGKEEPELAAWLAGLEAMAAPFAALLAAPAAPLGALLAAHADFAEAMAATAAEPGAARLWAGDAGEAAATFVAELAEAADALGEVAGERYPALLAALLAGRAVRPRWGSHPRLAIWGLLEARLQHADLLVLGGLNEGSWPADAAGDPWLSRPMRAAFGLPPPERRTGQAAHDFAQAFCAPEVVLTRSLRVEGAPTVPSRWLLRLEAYCQTAGLETPRAMAAPWLAWQAALDAPSRVAPLPAPRPRPPVAARPRELPATQVEQWMRDPYAIYARYVLRLKALEPLDAPLGAADRGSLIHETLDRFVAGCPGPLPPDALDQLLAAGRTTFEAALAQPAVWAFWWPRFERIARWFVATEAERRPGLAVLASEIKGTLVLAAPAGPFTLTARADRVERRRDGGVVLVDYKTGTPPKQRDIELGFAPQLPLEAAIAMGGGFPGLPAAPVAALEHWRLTGGTVPGQICPVEGDPAALGAEALAGLAALVAAFDDPATPYEARPAPRYAPRFSDYAHLARIAEWAVLPGDDE